MTYYVRTDGSNGNAGTTNSSGGAWLTIDFAASQVSPGDVVRVQTGTYSEVVTPNQNGSSGNPITFVADGVVTVAGLTFSSNSYIRWIGFTFDDAVGSQRDRLVILGGTNTGLEFWNNAFAHGVDGIGMTNLADRAVKCMFIGNRFSNINVPDVGHGAGTSLFMFATHCLIAYNEIGPVDCDAFGYAGQYLRYLNNYLHDVKEDSGGHSDFFQTDAHDLGNSFNLIEGNFQEGEGNLDDEHTGVWQNLTPSQVQTVAGAVTENIWRRNVWHHLSGGSLGIAYGPIADMLRSRIYNNTTATANLNASGSSYAINLDPDTDENYVLNELFYDVWSPGIVSGIIVANVPGGSTFTADYNLAFWSGGSLSFGAQWTGQAHEVSNGDPEFDDYASDDFHIGATSAARGTGGPLTTVSGSGTGSTFNVATGGGGFFRGSDAANLDQYGGGLVAGDRITVGTDVVTVVSISGDAITVAESFTWANGDPVYFGEDATPDIGAFPYKPFGFELSATYSLDGTEITVVPNDDDLVRFVVIYNDGIPVAVLNESPFVFDPGAGDVEARVYPKYASKTLWVVAGAGACDAPPTNDAAADATVIPSLPYSHTQTCIAFGGTTYPVWYVWTATFDGVISVFGYGDGSVYTPELRARTGPDPGTLSDWPAGGHGFAENRALQIPVVNGEDYYFEFTPNAGDPTPATLHLSVIAAPSEAIVGAVFVNDDTQGFPAALLDPDTGDVLRFLYPFPNGEAGDILDDGTSLVEDFGVGDLKVYDDAFTLTNTLVQASGSPRIRAQRTLDRFYVGLQENPVQVVTVEADGEYGLDAWTLTGITSILALAANNAGTILYHSDNVVSQPIRRWDLVGEVALSSLAAGVTGYLIPDILVMADDSIVATFVHNVFGTLEIRHYAPDGTLLNTFAQDDTDLPAGTLPRLAYSPASGRVWIWRHTTSPTGFSHFKEIRLSDGATIREFTRVEYETGVYNGPVTASPLDRFGISFSCPFFVLGELTTPASPGSPGGEPGNPPDGEIGPIAWVEEWEDDV